MGKITLQNILKLQDEITSLHLSHLSCSGVSCWNQLQNQRNRFLLSSGNGLLATHSVFIALCLKTKIPGYFFLSSRTLQIALIIFNLKRSLLPTHSLRKFHDSTSEVTFADPLAQYNYPAFPWRSLVYFCSVDCDLIFYCPDFLQHQFYWH